jgi:2-C-methyl-D-erythritol 2,4-cyclodiphosphate synthase
VGHSDGDALLHAVTDALLGAIAEPDIGQRFPNDDPRNEARNSADFLAEALARITAAGYRIANLDATVILERPKLSPRKPEIRANLARLLALPESCVNIKGKTHEKVDAVGEGRAIETHAVVLLDPSGPVSVTPSQPHYCGGFWLHPELLAAPQIIAMLSTQQSSSGSLLVIKPQLFPAVQHVVTSKAVWEHVFSALAECVQLVSPS